MFYILCFLLLKSDIIPNTNTNININNKQQIQTLVILDNISDKYKYSILFDSLNENIENKHKLFYHSINSKTLIIKQYNTFIYQNIIFLSIKSTKTSFQQLSLDDFYEFIEFGGNLLITTDENMISNSIIYDLCGFIGIYFNNRKDIKSKSVNIKKEKYLKQYYNGDTNTSVVYDHFNVMSELDDNER